MRQAAPVVPTREQVQGIFDIVCDIERFVKSGQYSGDDLAKVSRALAYLESFKSTLATQVDQLALAEKAPAVVKDAVRKARRKRGAS